MSSRRVRLFFDRVFPAVLVVLIVLGEVPHRCCLFSTAPNCAGDRSDNLSACCCGPTATPVSAPKLGPFRDSCRCEVGTPAILSSTPRPAPAHAASHPPPHSLPPPWLVALPSDELTARARGAPRNAFAPRSLCLSPLRI